MKLHFDRGCGLHQVELETGLVVLREDSEVTFDFRGRWDGQPCYLIRCLCVMVCCTSFFYLCNLFKDDCLKSMAFSRTMYNNL